MFELTLINFKYFHFVTCVISAYFVKQTGGLAFKELLAHGENTPKNRAGWSEAT